MRSFSLFPWFAATLAWFATPALRAQDTCPRQTTEARASTLVNGPASQCKGIDLRIGGVVVGTSNAACPTFVVYTPAHEVAVPATTRTQVGVVSSEPVLLITFACKQDWFLFIPIGSSCVLENVRNSGVVHHLVAKPCTTGE
ncbi:MAG: hypothetical protein JNK49_03510 [Planctomycetes bacterium]|nr:hypothetical protein [Planctomycetota bacterium]